jgi:hypothetical protein
MNTNNEWNKCKTKVFWGEIAPCDHVVQIYEDNEAFLDTLAEFVTDGIHSDDCVIIIATQSHLNALSERLKAHSFDIESLISQDVYMPLDAEETLAKFMVDGWPDETLFIDTVMDLISKARKSNRQVRAFGEMVAVLWEQGHNGATVQLEHLWNKFCAIEAFCLFCAYPKSGFTQDAHTSIMNICAAHSKVISVDKKFPAEISYKSA